jgi:hypothetical protein
MAAKDVTSLFGEFKRDLIVCPGVWPMIGLRRAVVFERSAEGLGQFG